MLSMIKRALFGTPEHNITQDEMEAVVSDRSHVLIDVREPQEYASGHIPGAINMPLSKFVVEKITHDRPVVLVCQAGGRSAKALRLLLNANHPNVRHYPPGTGGWRARGGKID